MTEAIRILVLEDVVSDAELQLRELRRAGLAVDARIVETESDFRRELREFAPDLVLSDFSLPHFDGLAALKLTREISPDTPFLFVSGTIGEDAAVEAVREGATDYIIKGTLRRLPSAVRRAVEESRERRARRLAEQRAKELDRYFSLFMRFVPATAFTKDLQGRFVYVNPKFEQLLGKSRDEMRTLTSRDIYPAGVADSILENDRKVMESRQPFQAAEKLHFGGQDRHFLVTKFPIPDEAGEIELIGGISVDITQQVQAEQALANSEARFRGIVENTDERIWECDLRCRMTYNNPALIRILGYAPEEVIGQDSLQFVEAADRADIRKSLRFKTAAKSGWRGLVAKTRHKDGSVRWLESNGSPKFDANGKLVGFRGADRDVTQRVLQTEKLAHLSRMRQIAGDVSAAITRLRDREPLLREICRIAVDVGGLKGAWAGVVDERAERILPIAWRGMDESFQTPLSFDLNGEAGSPSLAVHATLRGMPVVENDVGASTLGARWKEATLARGFASAIALPFKSGGRVGGVAVLFSDRPNAFDADEQRLFADMAADVGLAIENMDRQAQIDYLAYFDVLTGLANPRLFRDRLAHLLDEARRSTFHVAVAIFDIERMRAVNDAFGRTAGDEVLREIAGRLAEQFGDDRVARIATDSFALAIPGLSNPLDAGSLVSNRVHNVLSRDLNIGGRKIRVGARCGVAMYPQDGEEPEHLLKNAEAALKTAKAINDRVVFYTRQFNADIAARVSLETRLRRAVESQQFVLHFQPKVGLKSGRIEGLEALIRWNDPETGLVPPARFIALLEDTGLILEVGRWAMHEAASISRKWSTLHRQAPRVAVNVSSLQLRRDEFLDEVRSALGTGESFAGLDLEITESMVMHDIDRSKRLIAQLREAGVRIALDDFGTGHSSLSHLARLPLDDLKIDRSFVHAMNDSPTDFSIVSMIVALARSLRLNIVAEGVETEEQLKLLRQLRCDQAQGYLLGRPVPAEQIEALLAAQSG